MEKICRVISQGALEKRDWQSPRGETVVIRSVQVRLKSGRDEFVGEVTDNKADEIDRTPLRDDRYYQVSFTLNVREGKAKEGGQPVYFNGIRINSIDEL